MSLTLEYFHFEQLLLLELKRHFQADHYLTLFLLGGVIALLYDL